MLIVTHCQLSEVASSPSAPRNDGVFWMHAGAGDGAGRGAGIVARPVRAFAARVFWSTITFVCGRSTMPAHRSGRDLRSPVDWQTPKAQHPPGIAQATGPERCRRHTLESGRKRPTEGGGHAVRQRADATQTLRFQDRGAAGRFILPAAPFFMPGARRPGLAVPPADAGEPTTTRKQGEN